VEFIIGCALAPTPADVTSHVQRCGFETMEQCKAMSSGLGGSCDRDPFLAATAAPTPINRSACIQKSRGVPRSKAAAATTGVQLENAAFEFGFKGRVLLGSAGENVTV
jgi:hypothetical protein